MTSLRSGSATDVGKVRTLNQDVVLEDPDLFAVADGMGGHVGGEVAARVAVDSLRTSFQQQPTVEGLRQAVAEANRAVWLHGQNETGLRGMGTTLTATALVQETGGRQVIALANVGDSRAYVYSKGQVIQVTADHSLAEEKVRQGQLTEAEAAVHPHRHILTRALGVSSDVDVDLWELHLHSGDRILLCSDGLTNEIGDERIGDVLGEVADPSEAAAALVKAAVDHGGSDNVTCVVVDVVVDVVGAESPAATVAAAAVAATGSAAAGEDVPVVPVEEVAQGETGGDGVKGEHGGPAAAASTRALRAVPGPGAPTRVGTRAGGVQRVTSRATSSATVGLGQRALGGGGRTDGADAADGTAGAGAGPPTRATAVVDEHGAAPNGASAREPGAISAARLQAAELRRLRPRDDRRPHRRAAGAPRLLTVRLVLFVVLLLAVVAAAYAALRWYAMDDWYVGVDHGHLAVYQGRPGGLLWFKPQLVDDTPVTTKQVLSYTVPHDRQEPSIAAAKSYVRNLHSEYLATQGGTKGTSGSPSSSGSSTATTGALALPSAAWQ